MAKQESKIKKLAAYIKTLTTDFPEILRLEDDNIVGYFSVEEIMSENFIKELMPVLNDYYSKFEGKNYLNVSKLKSPEATFVRLFNTSSVWGKFKSVAGNKKEVHKMIDKLLNIINSNTDIFNAVKEDINYMIFISDNEYNSYTITQMVVKNMTSLIGHISNEKINSIMDGIMTSGSYEEITSLYNSLSKSEDIEKEYKGYPVVIINPNLNQTQKIEIIKKTYKQKDTNKYLDIIRDKMKDINDLDSFIEATITQNNRIKEKSNNIVATIERVMVGVRGQYFDISNKLDKYENVDKFFDKYRSYFPIEACKYGLNDENNYYKSKNYKSMVATMLRNAPLKDKIEFSKINKELDKQLFDKENVIKTINNIKNKDEEKLLVSYLVDNYIGTKDARYGRHEFSIELLNLNNLVDYANKYPEIFSEFMRTQLTLVDKGLGKDTEYTWEKDEKSDNFKLSDRIEFIKNLSKENLEKVAVIEDIYKLKFGFDTKDNTRYFSAGRALKSMASFYKQLSELLKLNEPKINKIVEKELIELYKDESNVQDNLFSIFSQLITEEDSIVKELTKIMKLNSTQELIETLFSKFVKIVETYYPQHIDDIKKNFDKLVMDLKVIASIH
jgi:hypothetical protein